MNHGDDAPGQIVSTRFLREHDNEEFAISVGTATEFLEGYATIRDGKSFLEPFLWIDATAIELEARFVTENTRHFESIENLALEQYR